MNKETLRFIFNLIWFLICGTASSIYIIEIIHSKSFANYDLILFLLNVLGTFLSMWNIKKIID